MSGKRFTVTLGVTGWHVFDEEINAPIGRPITTLLEAQREADAYNRMYDEPARPDICPPDYDNSDFLYDLHRDREMLEAEDRARDLEHEIWQP